MFCNNDSTRPLYVVGERESDRFNVKTYAGLSCNEIEIQIKSCMITNRVCQSRKLKALYAFDAA